MPRIYYKEEKLSGQPIENNFITVELFDFIFNNTNTDKFELQDGISSSFFGFVKSRIENFKIVRLSRDGIHYKASEGNFYLPTAIIFCDLEDAAFPSEFYFIAKIENQIELRQCNAGKDIKWFQIPKLHKSVDDPKILIKVENSLAEIKKLVETTHNKQVDIVRKQKEIEERQKAEASRQYLNNVQKEAYKELTELCVYNNSNKEKILKFIETLKNYDKDSEYFTTLNYFMDFLDEERLHFIMRMDWKAGIEDLEWLLQSVLENNHSLTIELPKPEDYEKNASVSYDNVFEDFDRPLRKSGLQLGFIDTQSDEYIAILHKIQDKEKVEIAVNKIGYDYYDQK